MQQIDLQLGTPLVRTVPPVNPVFEIAKAEVETAAAPPLRSALIDSLLEALEREQISYCHWKSNWRINDWLAGDGDLDLLVSRSDLNRFHFVMARLGFKKALVPPANDLPGIVNFYGYDSALRNFIHIHAHYQLVLGHDASKNYRLPIEKEVLMTSRLQGPIRQPSPEAELAIFIVRMTLKYSATEYLARQALGKLDRLQRDIRDEYHFLSELVDPIRFGEVVLRLFPSIDPEIITDCGRGLTHDISAARMSLLRRRLERALRSQSRLPGFLERSKRIKRAAGTAKSVLKKLPRKRLESGGSLIAIVGGDGSGKSTCTEDLHKWLGKKFETDLVHLGMPRRSVLTIASMAAVRLRRWQAGAWGLIRGKGYKTFDPFRPDVNLVQRVRWLCTARDRLRLYERIRRSASNGRIVLCDRYPTGKIIQMDGPRIERSLDGRPTTWLEKILIDKEKSYYERILPPDQLIVLRVMPEIAVLRKHNEPSEHVSKRSAELWNVDWTGTDAKLVDAGRSRDEVLDEVRALVWAEL